MPSPPNYYSKLLTNEENELIFTLLGVKCCVRESIYFYCCL